LSLNPAALDRPLNRLIEKGRVGSEVINGHSYVYSPALLHAEQIVSARLKTLASQPPVWSHLDIDALINDRAQRQSITLSASQLHALKDALQYPCFALTGGPGTGKTTITKVLIDVLSEMDEITLCAPTGRAAKRLAIATGRAANTLHRVLGCSPDGKEFTRTADNPLSTQVLIIDETSIMDLVLFAATLMALPERCAVILIGDVDQLPSVGPGQVLRDCIESGAVRTVRLKEIHRQSQHSHIVTNAYRVLKGQMPVFTDTQSGDFHFIEANTPEAITAQIEDLMCNSIPRQWAINPREDVQVLTPMRRGDLGSIALNRPLQKRLFVAGADNCVVYRDCVYGVGDRVMQHTNNYEKGIFNGDCGYIHAIRMSERQLDVRFDDAMVVYDFDTLDELSHAYALTIHKAQGSEYPVVIIPISMTHYSMLTRQLLFTALTRARTRVFIVGERGALHAAIKQNRTAIRSSTLSARLRTA
jgi:exodeoxyribonuclease V alpha subunit